MDFLLNLKGLRIKPLSGRSGRLILDVKGGQQITAANIESSSDFQVANPGLYLLTLDDNDAHLYVEMDVEINRGFMVADSNDNPIICTIPQDAIFSPVEKVDYNIEPVHMGQEMSYERLHLHIWTDGTIDPCDAISQSASILASQLQPFTAIGAPPLVVKEIRPEKLAISEEKFNMPIEQLDISVRSLNCLRHAGMATVGELLTRGVDELMGLRNFGLKSLSELEERLQAFDLSFNLPKGTLPAAELVEEEDVKKPKRKRAKATTE